MFAKLFAQSGLSLDRLRALVEVGATGSIVRAAEGDPARQSQYSRQIKELEDFKRSIGSNRTTDSDHPRGPNLGDIRSDHCR